MICLLSTGFAFVFEVGIPSPCKQWTLWSRGLVMAYSASRWARPLRNFFKEGSASLALSDDVDRPAEESGCPSGPVPWPLDRGLQGVAQSGDACQVFCPELKEKYLLSWKKRKVANSIAPPPRPQPSTSEAARQESFNRAHNPERTDYFQYSCGLSDITCRNRFDKMALFLPVIPCKRSLNKGL